MAKHKSFKIICIKPGTKYLAVAVLQDYDLIFWKNFTLKDKKMSDAGVLEKFRAILNGIIQFWSPGTIAVEDVFYNQSRKSRFLNVLVKEIEKIGKERRLKVYFHSPVAVRKFICQDTKPTRMNVARVIAEGCYPGLKKDYEKEKKKHWWRPRDRLRVFDAIASGLMCLHKQRIHQEIRKLY